MKHMSSNNSEMDPFDALKYIRPVEENPFLLTRIKARLQDVNEYIPPAMKWAVAAMVVFLCINLSLTLSEKPQSDPWGLVESNQLYNDKN